MFLSCIWIRLVTLQCVQSQDKVDAEALKNNFFSFKYESHQIQFVFFLLPLGPSSDDPQTFQNPESTPNHQFPEIEQSKSTFECSTLLENLKITRNSIILKASNQTLSQLLYFECSSPVPNILGYFLIDDSIDLESNKDLQNTIINFLTTTPQTNDKIIRTLQVLDSFNDLVFNNDGCVPCAINYFDNLNSLSSEDLATIYLMLLNYKEVVILRERYMHYNCEMNPIFQALTKLLRTNNFRQAETICQEYFDNRCGVDIGIGNICENELETMINTHLEFYNLCYAKYFYHKLNAHNQDLDYWVRYRCRIWKKISALIYQYNQLSEFSYSYTTPYEENGLQIKLTYFEYDCNTIIDDTYLQENFCKTQFIYDSVIVFVNYSEFGDYAFRFTYERSSIVNFALWCYYQFDDYYLHQSDLNQCCGYIVLDFYCENGFINIIFYPNKPYSIEYQN